MQRDYFSWTLLPRAFPLIRQYGINSRPKLLDLRLPGSLASLFRGIVSTAEKITITVSV